MVTTTIWESTCSRVAAQPPSSPTWRGSKASKLAESMGRPRTQTASRSVCRRLDSPDLVLAPRIQSVVHRGLKRDLAVIVFAVHHRKAVSDRLQAGRLRGHRDVG